MNKERLKRIINRAAITFAGTVLVTSYFYAAWRDTPTCTQAQTIANDAYVAASMARARSHEAVPIPGKLINCENPDERPESVLHQVYLVMQKPIPLETWAVFVGIAFVLMLLGGVAGVLLVDVPLLLGACIADSLDYRRAKRRAEQIIARRAKEAI